jgi:hypothetical protein
MNRLHTTILAMLVLGVALTGTALAGDVDPRDVNFIKTGGASAVAVGGNPDAWASVGIVSSSDHEFISRDGQGATLVASPVVGGAVATVDGSDYRLIAGDGSPGATCNIALVAAIHPIC